MRVLLGITGHMGSGKSTVASYLASKYDFKKMQISGKMRKIAEELEIEPSRDFLQKNGEFMRSFDDDVWVKYVAKAVQKSLSSIVIDDIRRENEVAYLKPLGFKFVRIQSSASNRKKRIENRSIKDISNEQWERWSKHSTEIQVSRLPVDFIINNNKTLSYLEAQVDRIISELKISLE